MMIRPAKRAACSTPVVLLAGSSLAAAASTGVTTGRRALTADELRDAFKQTGHRLWEASTRFNEYRMEGERQAERLREWQEKNHPGSGTFTDQAFNSRTDQQWNAGRTKPGRSPLMDDPLHPVNFKKKMDHAKAVVESESMRNLPLHLTLGALILGSVITVGLGLFQEDWFPWKAYDAAEYVPYVPPDAPPASDDILPLPNHASIDQHLGLPRREA